MPKYVVSGVDKTSEKASNVEIFADNRASAQHSAEWEHNMVFHEARRLDLTAQRISGIGWARFFLGLWLVGGVLIALICLVISMVMPGVPAGLIFGLVAIIPGVAIPLCLWAILDGLERLVEESHDLR